MFPTRDELSTESATSNTAAFPLEARVVLSGLLNAPELNGKVGIVRSGPSNGRQTIYVEDVNRTVGIKVGNLCYEPRTLESLSVRELKLVLKSKTHGVAVEEDVIGMDKSELQARVREAVGSLDDISETLARAKAPVSASPSASSSSSSSVPTTAARTPMATSSFNGGPSPAQAAEQLQNLSPEQLRQQVEMMRSIDPDVLRRMNPQLASLTDQQIRMAADQMEMMVNNPQMMKAAAEQMKNMTQEQLEAMRNGVTGASSSSSSPLGSGSNGPPDLSQMGGDPAALLAGMDKAQLKQILQTLKDSPEMLKQFSDMSGMSEEQLKRGVETFSAMDDDKMDAAIKMMRTVQYAKDMWTRVDVQTGGYLKRILIGIGLSMLGLTVWFISSRGGESGTAVASTIGNEIPNLSISTLSMGDDDDDLASEF